MAYKAPTRREGRSISRVSKSGLLQVRLPKQLRARMAKYPHVCWGQVGRDAWENLCNRLEKKEGK